MLMKTTQTASDPIRGYLRNIGRIARLTHEQEILYGREVKQARRLFEIKEELTLQLNRIPTLEEWVGQAQLRLESAQPQDAEQLEAMIAQGESAKRKMIEANLRLVVSVAKQYDGRDMELLDLIQEGAVGLQRGVEKFDPSMGCRFSTYAYWWIRQAITDAIEKKGRAIRLPVGTNKKLYQLREAHRHLSKNLGRTATLAELANTLKLPLRRVIGYLNCTTRLVSLDLEVKEGQGAVTLADILEAPGTSPEEFVMQSAFSAELRQLLEALKPLEQEVITLRFGLAGGGALTPEQIGHRLNLSQQRAQNLEESALKKLRRHRTEAGMLLREISR